MNDIIHQHPISLPPPQGYPPQAYPSGIYPLAACAVYHPLPQGHVYVQRVEYYPPQGYPPSMGMRYPPHGYPPQGYHSSQYGAPPHGHGQGYPPQKQKQKQNQATTSVMGGCLAAMCCCSLLDACLE